MSPADPAPADFAKTFTDFWTSQGQAMVKAQEQATRAMTEGMQAMMSGALPAMMGRSGDLSIGTAELARASQSLMELWSAATTISGELAGKLGVTQAGQGDGTVASVLGRIADPRQWMAGTGEMDDVLGRMAEGPRLADLGEIERRYAGVMHAWIGVRKSAMEHNTVVLQAWLEAAQRFTAQIGEQKAGEQKTADPKATMKLWTEVANKHLLETQRSQAFLKTQRDMIRASTALRMAQQDLTEHFGKQYGFPTRTELDDVHRTVTELRRELRMMRRAMQTPAPAPAPVTIDKPVRAAAAARRTDSRKREAR